MGQEQERQPTPEELAATIECAYIPDLNMALVRSGAGGWINHLGQEVNGVEIGVNAKPLHTLDFEDEDVPNDFGGFSFKDDTLFFTSIDGGEYPADVDPKTLKGFIDDEGDRYEFTLKLTSMMEFSDVTAILLELEDEEVDESAEQVPSQAANLGATAVAEDVDIEDEVEDEEEVWAAPEVGDAFPEDKVPTGQVPITHRDVTDEIPAEEIRQVARATVAASSEASAPTKKAKKGEGVVRWFEKQSSLLEQRGGRVPRIPDHVRRRMEDPTPIAKPERRSVLESFAGTPRKGLVPDKVVRGEARKAPNRATSSPTQNIRKPKPRG